MSKKAVLVVALFCFLQGACFKRHRPNQNALLESSACITSISDKDYERALIHCELCLEFDRSMPECLNGIGLVSMAYNDEKKALSYFSRALRQDNDFCDARNNIGVIYFSAGNYEQALKYFSRALEINPSHSDARYNRALSHLRLSERLMARNSAEKAMKEVYAAKEQMAKLLALEPGSFQGQRDMGLIEFYLSEKAVHESDRKEHAELSLKFYGNCLEIAADEASCYEGLGRVYAEEGHFDQAFSNYFICLSHMPENTACRQGIVFAYEKSVQFSKSYETFSKLLKEDSRSSQAHDALCGLLMEKGLHQEAERSCKRALELNPQLCSAHFRLAEHFATQLNSLKAKESCQSYLMCERSPRNNEKEKRCQEIITLLQR
jgi:tetratricopeptide (TPR) repeat protein